MRWGRADLMRELLGKMYAREDLAAAVAVAATTAAAAGGLRMPPQRGRPAAAEAVAEAVQCALQCALEQRRVAIVALLLSHRASLSQVNLPALYTCASVSDATAAALATSASLTTLRSCPVNVRSSSAEEQRQMYEEGVLPFLVSNACTSSPRRPPSSSHRYEEGVLPFLASLVPSYEDAWVARGRQVCSSEVTTCLACKRSPRRPYFPTGALFRRLCMERRGGRVGSRVSALAAHGNSGGSDSPLIDSPLIGL